MRTGLVLTSSVRLWAPGVPYFLRLSKFDVMWSEAATVEVGLSII
jgi:hypothetical protein